MSGFYNEILFKLGFPPDEAVGSRITILDLMGVYVEGHGGVKLYSPQEIRIGLKRKVLVVSGEGMTIAAITKDEVYIRGKILSCEVREVDKD